jgi:hypothetical protein
VIVRIVKTCESGVKIVLAQQLVMAQIGKVSFELAGGINWRVLSVVGDSGLK